jgi:hypothetical protein
VSAAGPAGTVPLRHSSLPSRKRAFVERARRTTALGAALPAF